MNHRELCKDLHELFGYTIKDTERLVHTSCRILHAELARGHQVAIPEFGTLERAGLRNSRILTGILQEEPIP